MRMIHSTGRRLVLLSWLLNFTTGCSESYVNEMSDLAWEREASSIVWQTVSSNVQRSSGEVDIDGLMELEARFRAFADRVRRMTSLQYDAEKNLGNPDPHDFRSDIAGNRVCLGLFVSNVTATDDSIVMTAGTRSDAVKMRKWKSTAGSVDLAAESFLDPVVFEVQLDERWRQEVQKLSREEYVEIVAVVADASGTRVRHGAHPRFSNRRPRIILRDVESLRGGGEVRGRRVAVIVDTSGSMFERSSLANAVRTHILTQLCPPDQFATHAGRRRDDMRYATPENIVEACMDLDLPNGETDIVSPLKWASGLAPTDVYIITDCELGGAQFNGLRTSIRAGIDAGVRFHLYAVSYEPSSTTAEFASAFSPLVTANGGTCEIITEGSDELDHYEADMRGRTTHFLLYPAMAVLLGALLL